MMKKLKPMAKMRNFLFTFPAAFLLWQGKFQESFGEPLKNIDLLVLYSEKARDASIGAGKDIKERINTSIDLANESYVNSNARQRIRLVHVAVTTGFVDKSSIVENRIALQNPSDGQLDYVHSLRNQVYADIVMLVVDFAETDSGAGNALVCGMPSLPCDATFESRAFAAMHWAFFEQNMLAHELGHVMGLHHERILESNPPPTGAGPDAYGYRYWSNNDSYANQFSTVMAKARRICFSNGECIETRKPYFSNPAVNYPPTGRPMGIDHNVDPANSANAARVLREVTSVISNKWRENLTGMSFSFDGAKRLSIDNTKGDQHLKGNASTNGGFQGLRMSYLGSVKMSLDQLGNLQATDYAEDQIDCPPNALRFTNGLTGEVIGGVGTDGVVRAKGIISPSVIGF